MKNLKDIKNENILLENILIGIRKVQEENEKKQETNEIEDNIINY